MLKNNKWLKYAQFNTRPHRCCTQIVQSCIIVQFGSLTAFRWVHPVYRFCMAHQTNRQRHHATSVFGLELRYYLTRKTRTTPREVSKEPLTLRDATKMWNMDIDIFCNLAKAEKYWYYIVTWTTESLSLPKFSRGLFSPGEFKCCEQAFKLIIV